MEWITSNSYAFSLLTWNANIEGVNEKKNWYVMMQSIKGGNEDIIIDWELLVTVIHKKYDLRCPSYVCHDT